MKHIALVTTGLVGITNASLKLASRLTSEGFQVTYLCPIDIRAKVEIYGYNYIQLPRINWGFSFRKTEAVKNLSLLKAYFYHFTHLKQQYEDGVRMLNFKTYEDILQQLNPELIVVEQELHEVIFSAIKLNIPVKLLSPHFFNGFQSSLPPIRTSIIPNIGFKGTKLGILIAWFFNYLRIWARLWINRVKLSENRRSILKKYAKDIGFSTKYLKSRNFPSVYINTLTPQLSLNLLELEFPFSKPKNLQYIGAMVFEKRVESKKYQAESERIRKIIDLKKERNNKLIYCSLTTMQTANDITFIQNVIEAVKKETKWVLILSLGGNLLPENFKTIPKNVHLFKGVPQLQVLAESACSINHGGINTINECIHFKVPMLVYSGKKYDQNGCTARIAYHGLGLVGDKDLDNSDSIHTKINKILNTKDFLSKMTEMHHIYKGYESKEIASYL